MRIRVQLRTYIREIYNLKKGLNRENNTPRKRILNNKPAAIHFSNNATGFCKARLI